MAEDRNFTTIEILKRLCPNKKNPHGWTAENDGKDKINLTIDYDKGRKSYLLSIIYGEEDPEKIRQGDEIVFTDKGEIIIFRPVLHRPESEKDGPVICDNGNTVNLLNLKDQEKVASAKERAFNLIKKIADTGTYIDPDGKTAKGR